MARNIVRLAVALALPPTATPALAGVALSMITLCPEYGCSTEAAGFGALLGAGIGAAFGIPVAALIGLPVHHLLLRAGKTHAIFYALAGAIIGAPAAIVVAIIASRPSIFDAPQGAWLMTAALGLMIGAMTALGFWLLRRPDRDTANPATSSP